MVVHWSLLRAMLPAASAGHDVHAETVCFPGPDCELSKIEPDAKSGVCILGNLLSDGVLHLSPVNREVEATLGALASCQECQLSLSLSARQWMRLAGTLTLIDCQVSVGRLHRRPIQLSFCDRWNQRKRSLSPPIRLLPND